MAVVVSVALENVSYYFDKLYDYLVPQELEKDNLLGCRVFVPFGRGNSKRQGIILGVSSGEPKGKKAVCEVLDNAPLINEEMIKLVSFMKSRYFCTYYDAAKSMLPKGLNYRTDNVYSANSEANPDNLSSDARKIYDYLLLLGTEVSEKKILNDFSINSESDILDELLKGKYIFKDHSASLNMLGATEKMVRLCVNEQEYDNILPLLTPKQKIVAKLLKDVGTVSVKEITYFCGVTKVVVDGIVKKGMAEIYEQEIFRNPYENAEPDEVKPIVLSDAQQNAYDTILGAYEEKKRAVCALLFGVTGSGKTQVYMKLIDRALEEDKEVIVMVPEISLTPQTLSLFHKRYGKNVAVFHSRLSVGQRMDEWKRVKSGKAKIVVGTRSAVFAPFSNLGLIIIDEEQEHTYKSEMTPRYNAIEVAKFRSFNNKALLVLSSATPSVESYTNALNGKYVLAEIPERYGNAVLPEVITVDMRNEKDELGSQAVLSKKLKEELVCNMENGEQSILLLNRRGYNTFVACNSCGEVITCPNCSISMTYHSANRRIMCHYCGYSTTLDIECPECHQKDIRYSGSGTQKIEEELQKAVPNARILRMDVDTTMNKESHEKMLCAFSNGDYDIMIGTQMVAKGLDFPNVTLAAVVSADQTLYNYDYRSVENTFDLITQIVGRSGRGDKKGRAIIQTITPDNPIIALAAKQDYNGFYKTESSMRKLMIYPPFCDLCFVGFVSNKEVQTAKGAMMFFEILKEKNLSTYSDQKLIVLGPTPAKILKANNKFRYRMIIKCKNSPRFREMMKELLCEFGKNKDVKNTTVFVDMNPVDIM